MKQEELRIIEQEMPELLQRGAHGQWPPDDIDVRRNQKLDAESREMDEFFGPRRSDGDSMADWDERDLPRAPGIGRQWPNEEGAWTELWENLREIDEAYARYRRGLSLDRGDARSPMGPHVGAWYWPWHRYPFDLYGIYVTVEAVLAVGMFLYRFMGPLVSLADCQKFATGFFFHHEQFHNIIETSGHWLEIAHRIPIYNTIIHSMAQARVVTPGVPHEESLAHAYAMAKVVENAYKGRLAKGHNKLKRALLIRALQTLVSRSPHPYSLGVLYGRGHAFETGRCAFQEAICQRLPTNLPSKAPSVWARYPSYPRIRRDGYFSYAFSRQLVSLRERLRVPYPLP